MPSLDPKVLEELKPYLTLVEKIGSFHSQLAESYIKKIEVEYCGDITKYDTKPLTLSLVKGILSKGMSESVNYVNALFIAKERGYEISETVSSSIADCLQFHERRGIPNAVDERGDSWICLSQRRPLV